MGSPNASPGTAAASASDVSSAAQTRSVRLRRRRVRAEPCSQARTWSEARAYCQPVAAITTDGEAEISEAAAHAANALAVQAAAETQRISRHPGGPARAAEAVPTTAPAAELARLTASANVSIWPPPPPEHVTIGRRASRDHGWSRLALMRGPVRGLRACGALADPCEVAPAGGHRPADPEVDGAPEDPGEEGADDEPRAPHPQRARHDGHHDPEAGHEPAEDHGGGAAPREPLLHPVLALLRVAEAPGDLLQDRATPVPREGEEDGRAEHGRDRHDRDDGGAGRLPLPGEEAGGGDEEVAGDGERHARLLDEDDPEEA